MKLILKIFVSFFILLSSQYAFADVISDRQANFSASGKALRIIGRAIDGGDFGVVADEAMKLSKWADMIPEHFPEGSNNKKASPDIWNEFALFETMAKDFGTASRGLADAAQSGDIAVMKAKLNEVGSTCQSCHQRFRTR